MATVKSKLKEALLEEKDKALDEIIFKDNPTARLWLDSINRLIKVCADRKRY